MVRQERLAAVGQLAAGIAHDFNNILTGISGFAELLQVSPKTPESMQPSLQKIIASTRRAAHLVSQLLDFSGKGIHRAQRVELDALLRESVGLLERSFPGSIKITLNVAPGNYLISADPAQLQQVVTNLALNAGDAMPSGGNMEIGLSRVEMAGEETCPLCGGSLQGEWVCLSVADTDGGIPADLLPRIFEPFFTTKEIGQRTGLGLSQVLGIVRLHNGHIAVHSRVGRGATFAVYLPPASEQDGRQTEETRPAITPGQGQTVLLVEDDPAVAETIQAMLEHRGYRVITAVNGREALAACREHPAETALVLSDMVMPDMGGGALFRALRAEDPGIKVIMMSDYPLGEEGAKLLEQGVSAWLEKPVSFGRLSQAMDRALSNRKGRWG
jgi:CheY-like chemotaxis protein